ncbi:MAG: VIT domain-containing protein [Planctomycetota bacterium]
MPRAVALLGALIAVLAAATAADAAGILLPLGGGKPIGLESHRITAVVTDGVARTKVRQTFVNRNAGTREAIYLFPLPEGAAIVDVAMEVGGERLEGLLAERKQARRVYDRIVRGNRDPALVEQIGACRFRLSVFPVERNQPTVVELTYVEPVPVTGGELRYLYPLALGAGAATTLKDLTASVTLRSSVPLSEVRTGIPDAEIVAQPNGDVIVGFEKTAAKLDRDFTVTAKVVTSEPSLSLRTWRPAGGDGTFMAVLTPPPVPEEKVVPRDVVLVLDTSGSMGIEDKMEQAKRAARHLLAGLRETDRVNIVLFSTTVAAFAKEPVPATPENLVKLRKYISGIQAVGGTALGDALGRALELEPKPGRVPMVVLLTDGAPTLGLVLPSEIVGLARRGGEKGIRVFAFGVGTDVHAGLLRGIARASSGSAELFRPGAEIAPRLTAFLDRTRSPVLTEVHLSAEGVELDGMFPRKGHVTYAGEQLVITGSYRGSGKARVMLSACLGDEPLTLTTGHDFRAEPGGDRAVSDLHGRRTIAFLEDEARLRSNLSEEAFFAAVDRGRYSTLDEVVDAIVDTSLRHGVQSAFTSFIVLLPEDRARIDPRDAAALRKAVDRSKTVRGLARAADVPVGSETSETDVDLPFEESIGAKDFISDAPFEGPGTGAAIGVGGGVSGAFGGRGGNRNLRATGGAPGTASSVQRALAWLKLAQREDGGWEGPRANTGLALLAFLGAGNTHKHGSCRRTLKYGFRHMKQLQDAEGCFTDRTKPDWLAEHAILTLAMAEIYGMTGSPLFKQSAQSGIDFLGKAQVPYLGWGRGVRSKPCDATTTLWAVCALKSARVSGLRTTQDSWDGAQAWLSKATDPESGFLAARKDGILPSTTDGALAGAMLARIFLGENPAKTEWIRRHAEEMAGRLPVWSVESHPDLGYLYFGTLAAFQVGGRSWKAWNEAMSAALRGNQEDSPGKNAGSWAPAGVDGKRLGRVGTTAIACLCLEVYGRYGRIFKSRSR